MKGVIIKVYVETSRVCPQQRNEAIKRTNPVPSSSSSKLPNARRRGYDRRAELLAYAQKLRHGNAQPSEWQPSKSSTPKQKKWRWSSLSFSQIRLSFPRLFYRSNRQWRYERINTEDYNHVQRLCCGQKTKRKSKDKRKSHFCEKFKCFIKELSCGSQCIG